MQLNGYYIMLSQNGPLDDSQVNFAPATRSWSLNCASISESSGGHTSKYL